MEKLKKKLASLAAPMRERIVRLVQEYGHTKVSEVTIAQFYGGMRGVKALLCETSVLDPMEGVRFRGYSIPELRRSMPAAFEGGEPLPEGLFYLLLTGEIPGPEEAEGIRQLLHRQGAVPEHVFDLLDTLPRNLHPMTQLSLGVTAMQGDSEFARRYREGMAKNEFWEPAFTDMINILGRLPAIAAYIYRRNYRDGRRIKADTSLDWAANYAHMMGIDNPEYWELMRLFLFLHADHEGGNVCAHTSQVVASTLADPYYALAAGINGLAGPLHGLANQEVLKWILRLREECGASLPSREQITDYVWRTLEAGRVVPGYGHAVLRNTDPRFLALRDFARKHLPDDELVQIVSRLYEIVPPILEEQGRAKSPWPNVDAHSGCLHVNYGVTETDYYTVFFAVSRALGILSWLTWSRILGLPIERPKSLNTEYLESLVVRWTEDLSVGVASIDRDHKTLIDNIQKLIEGYNKGQSGAATEELFAFLENYVREHFEREKRYMEKHRYPEIESHLAAHRIFVEKVAGLRERSRGRTGRIQMVLEIKQTLMDWFTNHILKVDKKLARFLLAAGVEQAGGE